jgi:phage-related minor tail protein
MADEANTSADDLAFSGSLGELGQRTRDLTSGANSFARAMTSAFAQSVTGGRQFDDVLKSLALRISDLSLKLALKPLTQGLAGGIDSLFSGLLGGAKPFAAGGVIAAPTYFPLGGRSLGLAGEAGPEAILPLARGTDGRLGVAASGGGAGANVTVHIATPDAESFRRSETYVTGMIARAVARGQRGL